MRPDSEAALGGDASPWSPAQAVLGDRLAAAAPLVPIPASDDFQVTFEGRQAQCGVSVNMREDRAITRTLHGRMLAVPLLHGSVGEGIVLLLWRASERKAAPAVAAV